MRKLIVVFLNFFCMMGFAQTKLIAHKSHSGNNTNFREVLSNDLFNVSDSNFGEAPQERIRNAKLDTVIYISAEKAIMVTSQYCTYKNRYEDENLLKKSSSLLWKKGKDTVFQHPLFSRSHSLDSIKAILKQEYHFKNNIDSVVFIGFDNKVKQDKKEKRKKDKAIIPIVNDINFLSGTFIIALVLILISIVVFFIWRIKVFESYLLDEK